MKLLQLALAVGFESFGALPDHLVGVRAEVAIEARADGERAVRVMGERRGSDRGSR